MDNRNSLAALAVRRSALWRTSEISPAIHTRADLHTFFHVAQEANRQ